MFIDRLLVLSPELTEHFARQGFFAEEDLRATLDASAIFVDEDDGRCLAFGDEIGPGLGKFLHQGIADLATRKAALVQWNRSNAQFPRHAKDADHLTG